MVSPADGDGYGRDSGAQVQLASTGTRPFAGLVALTALNLPAGITATFSPAASVSAAQPAALVLAATAGAAAGPFQVTIRGELTESGQALARTRSSTHRAGRGRRDRRQGPIRDAGARGHSRRDRPGGHRDESAAADVTDAAGNFTLVGLPAGQLTLRFDATPANPLYPIWPYTTTLAANQVSVLADWTINPPPTDDKFTPIANAAQEQVITDPRFPGLEVRLPAGARITGWDGVVKSRSRSRKSISRSCR